MVINRVISDLKKEVSDETPASSALSALPQHDSVTMMKQVASRASSVALYRKEQSLQLGLHGGFLTTPSKCFPRSPPTLLGLAAKKMLKFVKDFSLSTIRHCGKLNTGHSTASVQELLEQNLQENVEGPNRKKEEIALLIPEVKAVVCMILHSMTPSNRAIEGGGRRGASLNIQYGFLSFLLQEESLSSCKLWFLTPDVRVDIVATDVPQQRCLSLPGPVRAPAEGDEACQPSDHDANEVRRRNDAGIDLDAVRQAFMLEAKQGPSSRPKASVVQDLGDADSCVTKTNGNEDEHGCLQEQDDRHLASADTEGTSGLPLQGQVNASGPPAILGPQSVQYPAVPCDLNVGNERIRAPSIANPRRSRANAREGREGRLEGPRVSRPEERNRSRAMTIPEQCTENSEPPVSSQHSSWLATESRPPPESLFNKVADIKKSFMAVRGLIQDFQHIIQGRPIEDVQVPAQELVQVRDFQPRRGGVLVSSNRQDRGCVRSDAPSDLLRQDTLLDVVGPRNLPVPRSFLWQVDRESELCPSAWTTLQLASTRPGCASSDSTRLSD